MFRRAAVFPVCLASGEICLYPSTCRFPPFDAKLAEKQERHVADVSFLFELVKKGHSPFLTKLGIAPTRAFSTGVRQKSRRMLRRHSRRDRMLKICHRHIFLTSRRGKNDLIFSRRPRRELCEAFPAAGCGHPALRIFYRLRGGLTSPR